MINDALFLADSLENSSSVAASSGFTIDQDAHLKHCVQYLAQSVMCAGDTTLETASILRSSDGVNKVLTASFGTRHQCADWDAIYGFAEKHSMGYDADT